MNQATKVAHVFPGQGAQAVGMGRDLYDGFSSAKTIFEQADEVLDFTLSRLCFEGPEEELRQTINAQPAILTVSYACLEALREQYGDGLPSPAFVAGHSLGEYTALAAAGVLDFKTTVRLARERGRLMQEAGTVRPGTMAAIIGLDEEPLAEICRQTNTQIANINCPGQIVISGESENVPRAAEMAKSQGASRTLPLAVSGAFHSELMQPAVDGMSQIIATLDFKDPAVPVIGNTSARPLNKAEEIKSELITQLCNCVQWQRSVEYMIKQGITTFIEIGPGKVLSGLIKRTNREAATINVENAEAVNSFTLSP